MIQINRNPSVRQLRWFAGLVFPLFCGWLAWIAHSQLGITRAVPILLGLAIAVAVLGLALPTVARWVWVATMTAVFPIGFVISHVLLLLVYYVAFSLVGLALRLAGKDPMTRTFDADADTYWVGRDVEPQTERYFRQY